MTDPRWERLARLTGVGFVVLFVLGMGLIGEVGGTSTPSSDEIVDLLHDGPTRILVGAYLSLVASAFLLWFVGSLRSTLSIAERGTGRLSAVAFGGGTAATAALVVSHAAIAAAAMRAASAGGITPDAAMVFHDLHRIVLGVAVPIGLAVTVGATAMVSFRTGLLPGWLARFSAVLAIALVSPLLFFFLLLGIVWVLVVSIWLYRQEHISSNEAQPNG